MTSTIETPTIIDPAVPDDSTDSTDPTNDRSDRNYVNPVPYEDGRTHTAPDPFVVRYRGLYYCYATDEHGVLVSTSPDLVRWTSHGFCYTEPGRKNYWAPSVILLNGVFHMYFSNMPEEESDTHTEVMRVATSEDPLGPFEKRAELFDTFAIDSQAVMGDDGRLYLLYADNQTRGLSDVRPGTSVMIDRLATPFEREGRPRPLIEATMDEEIFARNRFGDGRDWHTVEGATYFTYRDKAFITYSANAYEHEDYFVGYSTAELPDDPFDTHIDGLRWSKQLNNGHFDPLLIRSDRVEGTGHNSLVKAPNGVDDWIVYHGRNAEDALYVGTEQRVMRIDPLYYAEGLLDTDGPTADRRGAPLRADVSSDFSQGVPEDWNLSSGSAHVVEDGGAAALETCGDTEFVAVSPLRTATQTIGVWVKGNVSPLGGRFGLIVRLTDAYNQTVLQLDIGSHSVLVMDCVEGVVTESSVILPDDLDLTRWHDLVAVRNYGRLEIRIDDRHIASVSISDEAGESGLISTASTARFSDFTATDHVNLWGESMNDLTREIDAEGYLRLDGNGGDVSPWGVKPVSLLLRRRSGDRRYVLDFAFGSERSETLIGFGEYRISLTPDRVEMLRDGVPVPSEPEPVRLRSVCEDVRRDRAGRALRTIRLAVLGERLLVHVRGLGWSVPIDDPDRETIRVSLNGASLIGYTRTSSGHGMGKEA